MEEQGEGKVTGLRKLSQGVGLHGEDGEWGGEKWGGRDTLLLTHQQWLPCLQGTGPRCTGLRGFSALLTTQWGEEAGRWAGLRALYSRSTKEHSAETMPTAA